MAKAAAEPPAVLVVRDAFLIDVDGMPVAYRKGEPVDPEDPVVKSHAHLLQPIVFPHPVRRATILSTPEVRAE